ncbi:MAG: tail needle knob protein [Escherichia coli]|nr:tail needle knob protein [Escherichia coli]
MADSNLNEPVIIQATRLDTSVLPRNIFSQSYLLYVIAQGTDVGNVANKANEAGQGAYDAQVRNDAQDVILVDHEIRLASAEAKIQDHETRITNAEAAIVGLDSRLTTAENDIDYLTDEVVAIQNTLSDHETRIDALEYATTRKKSEVVYSGVSVTIPTAPTNLVSLLKTLTPSSGSLAPFFDTVNNKMVVFNENKTLLFKLSIVGTWPSGTSNRSMQLTFSGSVPDTLVSSRNSATTTDNILLATFFSVDKDGFLATNGSTLTIQSNGAADGYDYKPDCRYFEVNVHGQFGGIVYYQEIQPLTFDCHAMYLPEIRGFSKEIGLAFWRYILTNTTVQCVTSFAARKFRHGQIYCAMIGLKRVGTIKKYFKGVDDVTFYSATREELIDFLNHGR